MLKNVKKKLTENLEVILLKEYFCNELSKSINR